MNPSGFRRRRFTTLISLLWCELLQRLRCLFVSWRAKIEVRHAEQALIIIVCGGARLLPANELNIVLLLLMNRLGRRQLERLFFLQSHRGGRLLVL